MESQNTDHRDSKKSSKNGNGKSPARGGGSSNGGGGGAGKASSTGIDKQRSHSQKSGKRYQEIYKPPSLRSSKNRSSNSTSDRQSPNKVNNQDEGNSSNNGNYSSPKKNNPGNSQSGKNTGNGNNSGNIQMPPQLNGNNAMNNDTINYAYSLFGNGNDNQGNSGNSSVPSSPLISNRMQNGFNLGLAQRMFNVNAKEFQFLPIQQQQQQQMQQQQQLSNFLSQFDPSLLYNNSPILGNSGCFPLKQSKSSGNMNLLLQQAQQQQQAQAAAIQQLQLAMGLNPSLQAGNFSVGNASSSNNGVGNHFNRLSQSKSSGNVPGNGNRPRVRFDDEEVDFDDVDEDFIGGQLGNYLASLKLNGELPGMSPAANFPIGYSFPQQQQQQQPKQTKTVPLSPQPVLKSSLQKSRTGFYLNLYGNQNQQQQQHPQQQQMQLGSPTKQHYGGFNASMHPSANYPTKFSCTGAGGCGNGQQQQQQQYPSFSGSTNVKRSRSFGPGTHHHPRVSATALLSSSTSQGSSSSIGHSVYSDFCITKWPKAVQELVTAAVTGVERIPARNWIEMVNGIFEAMLCDYRPKKIKNVMLLSNDGKESSGITASNTSNADSSSSELSKAGLSLSSGETSEKPTEPVLENNDHRINLDDNEEDEEDNDDGDTDLTSAAVHIFLYFIQREKDRTVMESLLNTCFASFQRLSTASVTGSTTSSSSSSNKSNKPQKTMDQIGKPPISRQWSNFLRFLSSLYSQVKLIRRQKQSQQQSGHSMNETSFSLLALLCDSCLATLRSPQSYTAEMMGCLFTVLTSIGRDMEGTFPLKMKQLLAAVRDALLGIGPYHQQHHHQLYNNNPSSSNNSTSKSSSASSLSPIVQKTLMQLIELHAANWQLPASAVRYYYSSVSNSKSSPSFTTNNNSGGGSTSFGNTHNQTPKSNNDSACSSSGGASSTTHNYISSTSNANASLSSQSSVSDKDGIKDSGGGSGVGVTSDVSTVNNNSTTNGSLVVEKELNSGDKTGKSENESTKDDAKPVEVATQP